MSDVGQIGDFRTLLSTLSADALTRGKQFERVTKWWLENDPIHSRQIEKVWLWDEWPEYPGRDIGIDLVALLIDGSLMAVQAKCVDESRSIPKSELDSFVSAASSSTFKHKMLVATTDGLSANAQRMLADQHVVRVMLSDLETSVDVWPRSINHLDQHPVQPKATPRPHQQQAISGVTSGMRDHDRGQLIMACGTGKTLTALWITEQLKPAVTLVLVPSLNLLSQTLSEWSKNTTSDWSYLCVCSDDTVNKSDDQPISTVNELPFEVTTNPDDIATFLTHSGTRIIFSTYQSSARVAQAQLLTGTTINLVICDEAHRLTGKTDADYSTVLDNSKIVADKRLFMTATPRTYTPVAKSKAEDRGVEITSMDDETVYGPVLHKLSFGEAIKQDLLSDYRVLIVGVTDPQVQDLIDRRELVSVNDTVTTDARTLAAHIGLAKATKDYNLKRTISFHSRIKSADQFAQDQIKILDWLPDTHKPEGTTWTGTISGAMNTGERRRLLTQLKQDDQDRHALLTNARCLTEGVDVPSLDGVAFIDPRSSQVDIIQAVGRAIRKSANKEIGTIVLPVLIPTDADAEHALEDSSFKPLWAILNALKSHDEELAIQLNNLRTELGRTGTVGQLPDCLVEDLPADIDSILPGFSYKLSIAIVENLTSSWNFRLGFLQEYFEEFGTTRLPDDETYHGLPMGNWVQQQRQDYRKQILSKSRIETLESFHDWTWTLVEDIWQKNFENLREAIERSPINLMAGHPTDSPQLNGWIQTQRGRFARGKLENLRIVQLESLDGWTWNVLEAKFELMLALVNEFSVKFGNTKFNKSHSEARFRVLASWAVTIRQTYKSGKLSDDKIQRMNQIPGWSWDPLNERWNEMYDLFADYVTEFRDPSPRAKLVYKGEKLGQWVSIQRQKRNKDELPEERIVRLEAITNWSWDPISDKWSDGYSLMQAFVEEHGHARVPQFYTTENSDLGSWVNTQRIEYKEGKISEERRVKLEKLAGWSWNPAVEKTTNLIYRLKEYEEKNGDCNVTFKADTNLAHFVSRCRTRYAEGSIENDLIGKLEEISSWTWVLPAPAFDSSNPDVAMAELLISYHREFGQLSLAKNLFYKNEPLGRWLSNVRQRHVRGTADNRLVELLEKIPGWEWQTSQFVRRSKEKTWNSNFEEVEEYVKRHGDLVLPYKEDLSKDLKAWINAQRNSYRNGSLDIARISLLEALPGWTWDPLNDISAWLKKLELLRSYLEREKVSSIPKKHLEDGVKINSWASYQRRLFREHKLSQTQISLLESIPYWTWVSEYDTTTRALENL